MESLLSTLKKKKEEKNLLKNRITGHKRKRYFRQSELDEIQSRDYFESQRIIEKERIRKKQKINHYSVQPASENSKMTDEETEIPEKDIIIQSLRDFGEPVTLFGESDIERFKRLRHLQTHGVQEEQEDRTLENDQIMDLLTAHEESREKLFLTDEEEKVSQERLKILKEVFNNHFLPVFNSEEYSKEKWCLKILERLIRDWEASLVLTDEKKKKDIEFRRDREIHIQCKQYIQPLLKKLRQGKLPQDVLAPLFNILQSVEKRQYISADSQFMKLSIGNSPWPMGVTNVGIHARSANEKIKTDSIAHVLNDETQRKYIQSVKRLITFAKRKYKKKGRVY